MRKARMAVLALVFTTLIFAQVGDPPVHMGVGSESDPFVIYPSDTIRMTFDDTYTADGVVLVRIEVEVADTSGTVLRHEALDDANGLQPTDGKFSFPLKTYVDALPNAGTYLMRCRVVDKDGNTSGWTEQYYATKNWKTLPAPGGCVLLP